MSDENMAHEKSVERLMPFTRLMTDRQKREAAMRKAMHSDTERFHAIRKLASRRWTTLGESTISSSTAANAAAKRCWRGAEELYDVIESNRPLPEDYLITSDLTEQVEPVAKPAPASVGGYDREVYNLLWQLNNNDATFDFGYFVYPSGGEPDYGDTVEGDIDEFEGRCWAVYLASEVARDTTEDDELEPWDNPVAKGRTARDAILNAMAKLGTTSHSTTE